VVWAVSLSTLNLCTQGLTTGRCIRRCTGLGNGFIRPLLPKRPLPQRLVLLKFRRTTKIVFVENQLSPGSVSFSLLPAAPPMLLQQQRVRPLNVGSFRGLFPPTKASAFSFPAFFRGWLHGIAGRPRRGAAEKRVFKPGPGGPTTVSDGNCLPCRRDSRGYTPHCPGTGALTRVGFRATFATSPKKPKATVRRVAPSASPEKPRDGSTRNYPPALEPGPSLGRRQRMAPPGRVLYPTRPLRIWTAPEGGALKVHPTGGRPSIP